MFGYLRRIIDSINEGVGRIIKYGIILITGIVFGEVIARYVFNNPSVWASETTELLFGFYVLLAGGYCILHDRFVKVDIFYVRWPARTRAIVSSITHLVVFLFCAMLFWYGATLGWKALLMGQTSGTQWNPTIWPYKMMLPVGFILVLLQSLRNFALYLRYAVTGKGELL